MNDAEISFRPTEGFSAQSNVSEWALKLTVLITHSACSVLIVGNDQGNVTDLFCGGVSGRIKIDINQLILYCG
jgi:hypothetical protein